MERRKSTIFQDNVHSEDPDFERKRKSYLSRKIKVSETKNSRKRSDSSASSLSSPEIRIRSNKKKKHRKKRYSSSSSSDNSSLECAEKHEKSPDNYKRSKDKGLLRDDWMDVETLVPTIERDKKVTKKKNVNMAIIAAPGQTDRELNPYWKDGGTGLPSDEKDLCVSTHSVGDKGLEWYEKAFQRAQEAALEQNRPLEDVVSERWGSLETLKSLIMSAQSERRRERDRGRHRRDNSRHYDRDSKSRSGYRRNNSDSSYKSNFSKGGSLEEEKSRFLKPGEEYGRERHDNYRHDRDKKWLRPDSKRRIDDHGSKTHGRGSSLDENESNAGSLQEHKISETVVKEEQKKASDDVLSDEQINALAAKIVKAEIMGNSALVEKLKSKLDNARKVREVQSTKPKEETIILMQTNQKGVTKPVQGPSQPEPSQGRRKKHNIATHSGGQRVRYFADDDQRDLKEMFEREKLGTMDDDKELFLKLAARNKVRTGSDEEDAFVDAARSKESEGKIQERERSKAIHEETRRRKTLEGCPWCLDNAARLKHLVVSIGQTCYLCLPAEESLTPSQCLIVPIQHSACGTLLDEDVWEEIHKFRKAIMAMARSRNEDVIMFEQAICLRNNPHMVLNCVILEKEIGDMAPIYFKKAILDSDVEWANNKRLVDIKGSDVRRSIPKGLPYFSVEFAPSGGFAHVIENEKIFPKYFAQEVIGGMLDLDHRKWRKPMKSNFQAQREKTIAFSKIWAKYDFTEKKKRSTSSSSSSDSDSQS